MRIKAFSVLLLWLSVVLFSAPVRGADQGPKPAPSPGISTLIEKLSSPDPAQRLQAKKSLLRLDKEVAPSIMKELPSANPGAAYEMIMILSTIDYPDSADLIEEIWKKNDDGKVKLAAALALCRFGRDFPNYKSYLLEQARQGEETGRIEAMQMIGYLKDPRVIPDLKAIFYDESQPDQVRQAAVWDLAHTPSPESARVLVEMVNDPNVDWFYKEIIITALRLLAAEEGMASVVSELLERNQGLPSRNRKPAASPPGE